MDKSCDLAKVRSVAMIKAHDKVREFKTAGIPVSSDIFSGIMKTAYEEARAECTPISVELTAEQMALVEKVCPACVPKYKLIETVVARASKE